MKLRRVGWVFLYNEGAAEELDIEETAGYLRETLKTAQVEVRGNPFTYRPGEDEDYARRLAAIKVRDVSRKVTPDPEPLYGEVSFEKRRILGKTKAFGVLYDGFQLQRALYRLIAPEEYSLGVVHIFFTNRLFATWEESDRRYHARTSLYGLPSIISTTGLVEAPARPREYYFLKQQYEALRKNPMELKEKFRGRFIDYGDERLTEVTKGYAMQAVFYSLTGNPFCQDRGCRLYNAHWQEELIFAQLESDREFCPEHAGILASL